MRITQENIERICPESDIYQACLTFDDKRILELGCGKADLTRNIATGGSNRHITALEVDEIQYTKNLEITDLPNVSFKLAGAEKIPEPGNQFDIVLMFKSLHHVPIESMMQSMQEIHRVLKPGGFLYISEPIFDGEFNEVLRLFHDEQQVRLAAFQTTKTAVEKNIFRLSEQVFFNAPVFFEDIDEFEKKVINVTHSKHQLSAELLKQTKDRFNKHVKDDGAHFAMPIRVDLLQKSTLC